MITECEDLFLRVPKRTEKSFLSQRQIQPETGQRRRSRAEERNPSESKPSFKDYCDGAGKEEDGSVADDGGGPYKQSSAAERSENRISFKGKKAKNKDER